MKAFPKQGGACRTPDPHGPTSHGTPSLPRSWLRGFSAAFIVHPGRVSTARTVRSPPTRISKLHTIPGFAATEVVLVQSPAAESEGRHPHATS